MIVPAPRPFSRRSFLAAGAASTAALGLSSCGALGPEASSNLVFWDMVWGTGADYTSLASDITGGYQPPGDTLGVSYQSIPWANWYQTFTSAVASNTGPSVSTGASFQPFFFLEQGAVAPADDLVQLLQDQGHADFLPGLLESMKTPDGYAGIPWGLDLRVLWYRESLLEEAGAEVPTDWDSYIRAGEKLVAADKIGFGMAASSSTTDAQHSIFGLFINNGGGLYTADGEPDALNERNVEATEFVREMVAKKIIDPRAASYTSDNLDGDWESGRIAMGFNQTGHDTNTGGEAQQDLVVADPLQGPHGDTGSIYYVNALMMYTNTPDQASSEEFSAWYLGQTSRFWEEGVAIDLPVTQSVADLDVVRANPNLTKSIEAWQPISKTLAAQASTPFGALNSVDGGQAAAAFVQEVVAGETDAKGMLEKLQRGLEDLQQGGS